MYLSDATQAFTHEAMALKQTMLEIPGRIAPALAGMSEQGQVKQALTDALHEALETMANHKLDHPDTIEASVHAGTESRE